MLKSALDPRNPCQWRAVIGIQIDQDVAGRVAPACFPGNDQPFARLVDQTDERNPGRDGGRLVGACVVDDEESSGCRDWARTE